MTIFDKVRGRIKSLASGNSATKHVLAVGSAAVAAQVIGVIAGPINSRLYHPTDYGTLAVFSTLFGLFSVLGTMRYEMAIPVSEDDTEGMHILLLCLLIAGLWAIFAGLVVLVAGKSAALWLSKDNPQMGRYIWFLPLGIFTSSVFTILSSWAVRKRAFVELSTARILQSLFGSGCMVVMGLFHTGALGLLTGSIVFTSSGVRKLFLVALRDFRDQASKVTFAGLKAAAMRHYRYPLYTTWAALLTSFSSNIPVFFLTKGFGSEFTGYFNLCTRILTLPAAVIGAAITPVFFSRMKQAQQEGNLKEMTIRMLDGIMGINAFFMVFLALFGEHFFTLAFGQQWRRSGQYAVALGPWVLCSFFVTPLSNLPLLFDRQAMALFFQAVLMGIRIGSLLIGIALKDDMLAMWLFGGSSALYMLVYMGWLLSLVEVPLRRPFFQLGRELLLAGGLLGGCRIVMAWSGNNPYATSLALIPVIAYAMLRGYRQLTKGRSAVKEEGGVA